MPDGDPVGGIHVTGRDADWHFIRVDGKVSGLMDAGGAYLDMKALEAERDRLRARTHEIAEAKDREKAGLEREVARHRNRLDAARRRVAHWVADWTTDPPSQEELGWWRYTSENHAHEVAAVVGEALDARRERDRLREALRSWMPHDHSAQTGPGCPVNGCERCRWEAEGWL